MQKPITHILISILAYHFVSCAPFVPDNSVRFIATDVADDYIVKIGGEMVGMHKNLRDPLKMCGHLNSNRTWLVIEDGCGGDSYPKVNAYRLIDGELRKSVELEQISKEHYLEALQDRGMPEPVFFGFDSSGGPIISSATGQHTLHE